MVEEASTVSVERPYYVIVEVKNGLTAESHEFKYASAYESAKIIARNGLKTDSFTLTLDDQHTGSCDGYERFVWVAYANALEGAS